MEDFCYNAVIFNQFRNTFNNVLQENFLQQRFLLCFLWNNKYQTFYHL